MEDPVLAKALETIRRHDMVCPGDSILVAVSGGADSLCLLHVLIRLQDVLDVTVSAVHVDHGLRAESSDEAEFVRQLCLKLGVRCTVERIDVKEFCGATGRSVQDAARTLRYEALSRVACASGARRIAVGHTADDQAETVLMRILKGTGGTGLAGIPPVRDNVIRPLLALWRSDTQTYCKRQSLPYIEDPSNSSDDYLRNKLRNRLIPQLESEYNPRLREALCRLAEVTRADEEYFSDEVVKAFRSPALAGEVGEGWARVRAKGLEQLPLALARRVLRHTYRLATGDLPPSFARLEAALALRRTGTRGGTIIELGGRAYAVRKGPWVEIHAAPPSETPRS